MTLNLISLFPRHLDLNGDQANLKVAQKRLEWRGYDSEIVLVEKGESLPSESDLIFLGHGSVAAWKDIRPELEGFLPELKRRIDAGCGFMAVASGFEFALEFGLFMGKSELTERKSQFQIANVGGLEVLGYVNSNTSAEVIQRVGVKLGTKFHGPVFAKNPVLADSFLDDILKQNNVPAWNFSPNQNLERISQIVRSVWDLERDMAEQATKELPR